MRHSRASGLLTQPLCLKFRRPRASPLRIAGHLPPAVPPPRSNLCERVTAGCHPADSGASCSCAAAIHRAAERLIMMRLFGILTLAAAVAGCVAVQPNGYGDPYYGYGPGYYA